MSVVHVRQKVIDELRSVQERVNHDARADVALQYCIKMIQTDQLGEQDFDFKSQADKESNEDSDSMSESRSDAKDKKLEQLDQKKSMKAWYAQFAERQKIGFNHNSLMFTDQKERSPYL